MKADLIIKNGRVIDCAKGIDEVMSIAVKGKTILKIGDCSDITAAQTVDAAGCIVTAGLIDSHMHLFEGCGYGSVKADLVLIPAGCTTGFDAGGAGCLNYKVFRKTVVQDSIANVKGFLNICNVGLSTNHNYAENVDPAKISREEMLECIEENRESIIGIKCRISKNIVGEFGLEPLKKAVSIAEEAGLPVVIHATNPSCDVDQVLDVLRPGDVFGHAFHGIGYGIVDENGHVKDCVRKAREKGVIFDVANGAEHFAWKVCKAALAEGFQPDTISSDMFRGGMYNPKVHSLPFIMSKYLAAGMSLTDIIRAVTLKPAQVFGLEDQIGSLREGGTADISVLQVAEGRTLTFTDNLGDTVTGTQAIIPQLTVRNGMTYYRQVDF